MKSAILTLVFVFSAYAAIFGQTSSDLKELLGQPASEIFQADKDVLLVAEYASDGNICRLKMIGKSFDVRKNAEKIYPNLQRGSFLSSETASAPNGWRNAYIEHYEKIILRVYSSGDKVQFEFSFNDRRCSSQTSPVDLKTILSPQTPQQETRDYYGKYETDEPAIITALPVPELTPEAVQKFAPETMEIQVILSADGTVNNIVMLGFLKNGMGDRVIRAVKKIIFKPALLGGQPVSQRIFIQYGIKKCDDGKICTFAREIVH